MAETMTLQARKIQTLRVALKPQAGSLRAVYKTFKDTGVNITASWAYEMGPADAEGVFCPSDLDKAKAALSKAGLKPTLGLAVHVEGSDRAGAYLELLDKIADAGINLHATDALSVNGRFATVFFADDKDVPALCKALGC